MIYKLIDCDQDKLYMWALKTHTAHGYRHKLKLLAEFIDSLIFRKIVIDCREVNQNSKIVFIYPHVQTRIDLSSYFYKIANTVMNSKRDYIRWTKKRKFVVSRLIRNICYLCSILYGGEKRILKWKDKLKIISIDFKLLDYQEDIVNYIKMDNYNLSVVLYDANIFDNYISQYFKFHGIKTATLQHGVMLAPRKGLENNIDFCGIEFKSSVCDYFLAWNEFTRKEAIKAGLNSEKIFVCGVGKCIGNKSIKRVRNHKFGVILDGFFEEENNYPLICIANQFANMIGYKYIARLHPAFKGSEYDRIIDPQLGIVCDKKITLHKYLESVEFCLVANSTVLFELEYYNFPFYRFASKDIKDKYVDYECCNFTNVSELHKMYAVRGLVNERVCEINNYVNFFKRFYI